MTQSVTLLERLPQNVLTVRARTRRQDLGSAFERGIDEVLAHLDRLERESWGPPCARHRPLGGGYVDLEVGLPVAQGVPGGGRVQADELPSGPVAVVWHQGALARLRAAYAAVETWIERTGARSRGAPWEIYWSDPSEEFDPLGWRTELVWPVLPGCRAIGDLTPTTGRRIG